MVLEFPLPPFPPKKKRATPVSGIALVLAGHIVPLEALQLALRNQPYLVLSVPSFRELRHNEGYQITLVDPPLNRIPPDSVPRCDLLDPVPLLHWTLRLSR
jgi:hypothetical protein